jgi:hypothetical protein
MLDKSMTTMYKSAIIEITAQKSSVILGCYIEAAEKGGGGGEVFLFFETCVPWDIRIL